jgi:CBS domain-containing protein
LAQSGSGSDPFGEDAMHTRVSEIMDSRTLCIEATFPADELMPLMIARNVARIAVVDSSGGALGIITRTDLLLRRHLDLTYRHTSSVRQVAGTRPVSSVGPKVEAPAVRTVRDVMSGGAFALSEAAPVARAAALMAYEGVECIVVISQHGRVVGLLSSLDIVRWVARSHGFSVATS